MVVGIVRAIGHDYFGSDPNVIALNVGWGIYSLIFLLAAIAVARETRQVRKTIRIDVDIPVVIHYANGIVSRSHTADLSMGGCRVVAPDNRHLEDDIEEIELILRSGLSRFRPSWSPLTSASCASSLMKIFRFRAAVNWCAWCWPARMRGLIRRARRITRSAPSSPFYAACSNCSG